jgi:tetratricopeptide (TPR) repeat protein
MERIFGEADRPRGIVKLSLVVVIIGTMSGAARADNLEEAKAAFADGKAAFERGDYDRALQQFQRANLLAPAPSLSYNIGKTYEKMGRYRDAVMAFERYIELVGEPKDDEDKKFQEDLKRRIEEDRKLPDRAASAPPPPPQEPPPQPPPRYQPYQPYGYQQPYVYTPSLVDSRAARLEAARRKRNGGITQLVVGVVFLSLGAGLMADASVRTRGYSTFSSTTIGSSNSTAATAELLVGVPCIIIGGVLIPVGIANLAVGAAQYDKINKEPPPTGPSGGTGPRAAIFTLPALHF